MCEYKRTMLFLRVARRLRVRCPTMSQKVTVLSWWVQYVPFLLEDKIKELGGKYTKVDDWNVYTQVDGKLITGQNPQSSEAVGNLVVKALA